jgi:hypothetical protein
MRRKPARIGVQRAIAHAGWAIDERNAGGAGPRYSGNQVRHKKRRLIWRLMRNGPFRFPARIIHFRNRMHATTLGYRLRAGRRPSPRIQRREFILCRIKCVPRQHDCAEGTATRWRTGAPWKLLHGFRRRDIPRKCGNIGRPARIGGRAACTAADRLACSPLHRLDEELLADAVTSGVTVPPLLMRARRSLPDMRSTVVIR